MTTAVAIEHPQGVLLAADTQVTDSHSVATPGYRKLFEVGECAFAFCGANTVSTAVRHSLSLTPPKYDSDPEHYVYCHVLPQMREVIPDDLHDEDFSCLIVVGGRIVVVDGLFECMACTRSYAAIGSGANLALVAMMARGVSQRMDLEQLKNEAKLSVQLAASLDIFSNKQVDFLEWSL